MRQILGSRLKGRGDPSTQAQLETHFAQIAEILNEAVDLGATVTVDVDWDVSPAVAALVGKGCEPIVRNRGGKAQVAPLTQLRQGLWAWIGYREEWEHDRPIGRKRRFSFRSVGLSIHSGWKFDVYKPQIFRAEWAGWAKWNGIDHNFQAADAGHPHWQFDALDRSDEEVVKRASLLREMIDSDMSGGVSEFAPQLADADIRDIVTSQEASRIHFASAAAWWKPPPQDQHRHGPESVRDLQTWLRKSVSYVTQGLSRLKAR